MWGLWFSVSQFGALAVALSFFDPQEPTHRIGVTYTSVDVIVRDSSGHPVSDLSRDDFQILEDGKSQDVTVFAHVTVPHDRRPAFTNGQSVVQPDVETNKRPVEGRVFALVLDDLSILPTNTARVRHFARRFIDEVVAANDLVAIIYVGSDGDDVPFTANRERLVASIDKFTGRRSGSFVDDDDAMLASLRAGEASRHGRASLAVLSEVCDAMAEIRDRRKAILYFSEGPAARIVPLSSRRPADDEGWRALMAASRGTVAIYPVDPRGLEGHGDEAVERGSPAPRGEASVPLWTAGIAGLRTLAEETGGFAIVNSNEISGGFQRIAEELSDYYVLGYQVNDAPRADRIRRLDVRVRRSGLSVRARRAYVGPPKRTPGDARPIDDLLFRSLPATGLTLATHAAAFAGDHAKAAVWVAIEVEGGSLSFAERNGNFSDRIEYRVVATDNFGKIAAQDGGRIDFRLRQPRMTQVTTRGFRLLSKLALSRGRYRLRIAIRDEDGTGGSVFYDLDVPDFFAASPSLSGILLSSSDSARIPTVPGRRGVLPTALPAPPTAVRAFDRTDTLAVFCEMYPGEVDSSILLSTRIVAADGSVAFRDQRTWQRDETKKGEKDRFSYTAHIPLQHLAPGRYVLEIRTNRPGPGRRVPIEIREHPR